ncbi:hypothetical protein [Rhizobium sp. BE258]|uniref:hypothetical protein n=1 Tax=Rhizobium sp. BE258 TaxID=2817722 RepID=UPI00285908A0|nr:hypothetical protein [Rhizobium sp. BE258]MDR7145471.1 hypothetical protein [Rhizobium sp. BE258]
MNAHDRASEQLPYPQLVKRVEVLEERMRAHFRAIAIIAAVHAESPNALADMLAVYRDRHLPGREMIERSAGRMW